MIMKSSEERIMRLEYAKEEMDRRMSSGAEAFSDLRNAIADVRADLGRAHEEFQKSIAPKPTPWYKIAGLVFGVMIVVIGWVWQGAKYPDREEFNSFRNKQETDISALREKQHELAADQRLLNDTMKRQEKTTTKMDEKLDKLLENR